VKKKQRRGRRRKKIRDLRQRIQDARDGSERQRLIAKMHRISRDAPVEVE
jgi:hypothetical protein